MPVHRQKRQTLKDMHPHTRGKGMKRFGREIDTRQRQRVHSPGTILVLACMLALAGTAAGCRDKSGEAVLQRPAITGVAVTNVTPVQTDEVYETSGTVRSDRTSIISSRVMGVVTSLSVKEGDPVRTGQLLLTLDDRDVKERMNAASMALEAARQNRDLNEITWKRYRSLYDQKTVSAQDMDQTDTRRNVAVADFERARAMAEEAKTYLAFTRITSPGEGVVTKKQTDVGSMASPGVSLLVIDAVGEAHVEAAVDEGRSAWIRPGMPTEVLIEALGKRLEGTVREVVPAVDPASRTFTIKIDLPDKTLRSGLFARVRIPVGRKEIIVVPERSVIRRGQLTGVYVVDANGIVTYRLIKEGPASGRGVEVLSGLSAQERIITQGMDRAVDGGIVRQEPGK